MSLHAYCYASGQIEIGKRIPEGALPLRICGKRKALAEFISGRARLAYDNETWLVPGVPEAPDQSAALDALITFSNWIAPAAVAAGLR